MKTINVSVRGTNISVEGIVSIHVLFERDKNDPLQYDEIKFPIENLLHFMKEHGIESFNDLKKSHIDLVYDDTAKTFII